MHEYFKHRPPRAYTITDARTDIADLAYCIDKQAELFNQFCSEDMCAIHMARTAIHRISILERLIMCMLDKEGEPLLTHQIRDELRNLILKS